MNRFDAFRLKLPECLPKNGENSSNDELNRSLLLLRNFQFAFSPKNKMKIIAYILYHIEL